MLRVVLDVNVLISALISPHGAPTVIVDAWHKGDVDLIVSEQLVGELAGVLKRPRFRRWVTDEESAALVLHLQRRGLPEDDAVEPPRRAPDPSDDYLIALALTSNADVLVTGDAELREVDVPSVTILTPREFVEQFLPPPHAGSAA